VSEQSVTVNNGLAKQAKVSTLINDVIASTKAGYLDYRCVQYGSDTSGLQIKMIVCADTVRDIDGNLYHAVRIGGQVWTVENLRVTKYRDGTVITKVTDSATWGSYSAYCYYNNITNPDSIKKWGALYNGSVVTSGDLAPAGWHVPTYDEWVVMQNYLVKHGYNYDGTTDTTNNSIAKALAAKTDWQADTITGAIGNILTNNNSSGFSALPGGYRGYNGSFVNGYGSWWSVSLDYSYNNDAYDCFLRYNWCYLYMSHDYESFGKSVRLVRNN